MTEIITVHRMGLEDIGRVIELGLTTLELQTGTKVPQFYSKDTLSKWIQSSNGILLTAVSDNNLLGFSITAYNPDSRDGYIHTISVSQGSRGIGIGSGLIDETLARLRDMGCNHVYCLVQTKNERAKKFFSRHGFEIGEEFNYAQRTI